jgi:hypothetical protein
MSPARNSQKPIDVCRFSIVIILACRYIRARLSSVRPQVLGSVDSACLTHVSWGKQCRMDGYSSGYFRHQMPFESLNALSRSIDVISNSRHHAESLIPGHFYSLLHAKSAIALTRKVGGGNRRKMPLLSASVALHDGEFGASCRFKSTVIYNFSLTWIALRSSRREFSHA